MLWEVGMVGMLVVMICFNCGLSPIASDDLFRPCPDSEITDSVCEVDFPADASAEHINWFNDLILQSYFQEQDYPWTRLGYSYDWNIYTPEVGVSEFVIRKNSQVIVESLQRVDEYF